MSVIKAGGVLYAPFRLPLSDVYVAAIIGVRGSAGLTVRPVDEDGQVCELVDAHFLDGFLGEETKEATLYVVGEETARVVVRRHEDGHHNPYYHGHWDSNSDYHGGSGSSGGHQQHQHQQHSATTDIINAQVAPPPVDHDRVESCYVKVVQNGHVLAVSENLHSYEPMVNLELDLQDLQSTVTIHVAVGDETELETHFDAREQGRRCLQLLQIKPTIHAAWIAAATTIEMEGNQLSVLSCENLPRHGVEDMVQREMRLIFSEIALLRQQTDVALTQL